MTRLLRYVLAGASLVISASAFAADDSPRCQVWERELGFAKSVADHDPVAFAEYLHTDTAFGVGRRPTIGRDTVTQEWQGIIDGSAVKVEWYPDVVTVGGDGNTAYSSGPTLYQDPKTGAYSSGRYGSVWQRDVDGAWRVIFDDGIRPTPVDEAAAKAFREGSKACQTE